MKRAELESLILEAYNVQPDFPWLKYPNYEVFRHNDSKKWLALIMNVPKSKLGLQGSGTLDVVNFKCDALLIGSLRCEAGFFPAYHMNKDAWISILLDRPDLDESIKNLLNLSYELTGNKRKSHSIKK